MERLCFRIVPTRAGRAQEGISRSAAGALKYQRLRVDSNALRFVFTYPQEPSMAWIDALFQRMVQAGASDLHMTSTLTPHFRLHGDIVPVEGCPEITPEQMTQILMEITPERNKTEFDATHDTDFAYEIVGLGRFRSN